MHCIRLPARCSVQRARLRATGGSSSAWFRPPPHLLPSTTTSACLSPLTSQITVSPSRTAGPGATGGAAAAAAAAICLEKGCWS